MQQARFPLGALVGLALSVACSGKDEAPLVESGGSVETSAGSPSANSGGASARAGNSSGDSHGGFAGLAASGGNGSVAGSPQGGQSTGGANGGSGNAATAGYGGTSPSGMAGLSSGGKSSGGASAGAAGSGGKGSGGASAGGASAGGASGSGGTSACPELSAALCGITAQHNQARANVSPVPSTALPPMTWDTTVAAAAQAWADQCNFSHNSAGYGQNLYASAGSAAPSPTAVLTSWVSESAAYNYSTNVCSGTCGHYTQVVWRNSTLLGCGFKACSTNTPLGPKFPNWYLVVCDYSPAGNNGSRPY